MEAAIVIVIVIAVIVIAINVFMYYLLWNRRSRAYFSRQSVDIRRQQRRR
ncbi:hypothetical protein ABLE92_13300 [Gordonia sp. VNQ95]